MMTPRAHTAVRLFAAGLGLLAAAACEQSKSANPLSPDVAGPIPGVAITAPTPMQPANGQQLVSTQENVQFVFGNPETNGQRPLWIQFQLASDANFQQVLHQADRWFVQRNPRCCKWACTMPCS